MKETCIKHSPKSTLFLTNLTLLLFLITAFILRFSYIFSERLGSDEALYAWCAKRIAENPAMLFSPEVMEFHPPLFSLLLSFGQLFFPPLLSDRVMVLLISLVGIFLTYKLGKQFSGWFLGLFCSLNLIFNYNYLLNGSLIFPDVLQMVLCVVLILFLMRVNADSSYRQDIVVGCVLATIFLVKWSGLVLAGYTALYYLYIYRGSSIKVKLYKLMVAHAPLIFCAIIYYTSKFIFFGSVLPDIAEMSSGGVHPKPFYYYLVNIHNILILPYLLPFFCIGLISLLKINSDKKVNVLLYLFVMMSAVSIPMVKNIRYILILLPVLLVIAGWGIEVCINKLNVQEKGRVVVKVIVLILVWFSHFYFSPRTHMMLERSFSTSTGLAEAGEWIKNNVDPSTTIISQNKRPLRYFSGINYQKFGGSMVLLPPHKKDFETLLTTLQGPVILQVDLWSESNPSDYAPFTKSAVTEQYFNSLGFYLVKDVEKYAHTIKGFKKRTSVVKIYEKR